jgi:aspartate/methionine/tyrosine aminotransferase
VIFSQSRVWTASLYIELFLAKNIIQLYSFSKVYALDEYPVGAITASQEYLKQLVKVMYCATVCGSKLTQNSAIFHKKILAS